MSPKKTRFRSRPPILRLVHDAEKDPDQVDGKHSVGTELDRMFRRYDRLVKKRDDALWGVDVLLAVPGESSLVNLFAAIMPKMASLGVCPSIKSAETFCQHCDGATSLLAIDIDQFDGSKEIIDWLLGIRDRNTQLTVLLMSKDFSDKADTMDPRSIADGALRVPADPIDLENALEHALERAERRLTSFVRR